MSTGDEVMVTEYVPPEVLKMGEMKSGAGDEFDCNKGSGNTDDCHKYGHSAHDVCDRVGSSAVGSCAAGDYHK
jgi:hypothetical protein